LRGVSIRSPIARHTAPLAHAKSTSIFTQVFVVVSAGSAIAFIIRDLATGDHALIALAAWVIQGPLLIQGVLAPTIGRLSDIVDRKYLAMVPSFIALAGAVVSATADSMNTLIGGGVLIGFTLPTISILQAIPAEVLPLKYRAVASGLTYVAGALGGLYVDTRGITTSPTKYQGTDE
jgi:MFS family permease